MQIPPNSTGVIDEIMQIIPNSTGISKKA